MHIEFLVEEDSAEIALRTIVPRIVGDESSFAIHPFQGKADLLQKLPGRLKGYLHWLPDDWRIVVLIDEDRQDCRELKARLEKTAREVGFLTWSMSVSNTDRKFQVVNRLAIEELEAWFFGDLEALTKVYPRVSPNLGRQAKYRNPDAITGGTWETLERVLQRAGYYMSGMPKVEVARRISRHMVPDRSRSKSFQRFRDTLREMVT